MAVSYRATTATASNGAAARVPRTDISTTVDMTVEMAVDTVRFDATSALVRVTGELDFGTSAPLWAVLDCHTAAGRRFLRLDMSGVTFLDATALSGIVEVHQNLLRARGTLVVTGVRHQVAKVLRVTGLDDVLFIGGPRADADTETRFDLDAALEFAAL